MSDEFDSHSVPPDEYLIEIGRIAWSWTRLEGVLTFVLECAISEKGDPDKRIESALIHMPFTQRMDALESVLKISKPHLVHRFSTQIKPLLKKCQEKRNAAIHHTWLTGPAGVMRINVTARGTHKYNISNRISIEEVRSVSQEIMLVYGYLLELRFDLQTSDDPQQGQ